VDSYPSRATDKNVDRLEAITENLRQMSLLFTSLFRRYSGHNASLSSFYKAQALEIDLVRQHLHALQLEFASGSLLGMAALNRKLKRSDNQLAATWHKYEASSIAANLNITHAYAETLKLVRNLIEITGGQLGDNSLDENANHDANHDNSKECSDAIGLLSDPQDCAYFRQCAVTGARSLARQKCGPGTLFNPVRHICDWPLNVYKVAPWCHQDTQYLPNNRQEVSNHENAIDKHAAAALTKAKTTTPSNRNSSSVPSANEAREVYTMTTPFSSTTGGRTIKKAIWNLAIIFLSSYPLLDR
jgi:Chitin binding Peritrophin-A domain